MLTNLLNFLPKNFNPILSSPNRFMMRLSVTIITMNKHNNDHYKLYLPDITTGKFDLHTLDSSKTPDIRIYNGALVWPKICLETQW